MNDDYSEHIPPKCACVWTSSSNQPGWRVSKPHESCCYHAGILPVQPPAQLTPDGREMHPVVRPGDAMPVQEVHA